MEVGAGTGAVRFERPLNPGGSCAYPVAIAASGTPLEVVTRKALLVGLAALAIALTIPIDCAEHLGPGTQSRLLRLDYDDFWSGDWSVELITDGAVYTLRTELDGRKPTTRKVSAKEAVELLDLLRASRFEHMPSVLPVSIDDAPSVKIATFATWGEHSVEVQAPWIRECDLQIEEVSKLWRRLLQRLKVRMKCQETSCDFCVQETRSS